MKKYVRLLVRLCLAVCLLSLLPVRASAWGRDGHRIVARIAWARLQGTPTLTKVKAILGNSQDAFLEAATWPDDVRGNGPYAYANDWHFISIPKGKRSFEAGFCAGSSDAPYDKPRVDTAYNRPYARNIRNCLLGGLDYSRATLRDPQSTPGARGEALKFIIHFIGDLHQPLHNSEDWTFANHQKAPRMTTGDRGGNHKFVCFFDECFMPQYGFPSNNSLHGTWDSGLIGHKRVLHKKRTNQTLSEATYASSLRDGQSNLFSADEAAALTNGTPTQWAEEAHAEAEEYAYDETQFRSERRKNPKNNEFFQYRMLGTPYYEASIRRVDRQLLRAGVRLAAYLEDVFGGQ